jgi:conjugal transfer pilus assembly protein TraD
MWPFRTKNPPTREWISLGTGINLDDTDNIIDNLGFPETDRQGHFWCFGTTRVGKTRTMESIVEQDIRKGNSVIVIDPKGDIPLFSKIAQVAYETNRLSDLLLFSAIFPHISTKLNPLSSYYMIEELVGHITAGVEDGREPFFKNVALNVSSVVIRALILQAKISGWPVNFNLNDIKNLISRSALESLASEIRTIETEETIQLVKDIGKILEHPADYYSKIANSLSVALDELTTSNIGQVIGNADSDPLIERLEKDRGVILVIQLGSLLSRRAGYTVGKTILSTIQALVGRKFAGGMRMNPPLSIHIDEAQSVLYGGIEELFAKAGGGGVYMQGYCQSINQLYDALGQNKAKTILDNCNTKLFMRVPDADTATFISNHLGEKKAYSPILSLGGGCAIRETPDVRIPHTDVLNLKHRQFFMTTYSGNYQGYTKDVANSDWNVIFPQIIQS